MNRLNKKRVPPLQGERRPLTWLSLAVPLLFACGQNANVPVNPDPYAGGVSYPWAYTAPEGQLSAQSLTADINTLSFEKIISAKNGWGPIERDRSNGEQKAGDGKLLTLNGKTYARGFGVHAGSEMRFGLKGTNGATCKRFTSDIGVDDEVGSKGSVGFQVYLDGAKAYDSGNLSGSSATQKINLNISGKKELRLVVTDAGDGISYDHADWANPQVDCRDANPATLATLDPSFGVGGIADIGGYNSLLEPDNSLIIVGDLSEIPENSSGYTINRLRPNGTRQIGAGLPAAAILRQADGKIVVAAANDTHVSIARLTADLNGDPSFGNPAGAVGQTYLEIPVPSSIYLKIDYMDVNALAQQADGKLLVAGRLSQTAYSYRGATLDTTFSGVILRYSANGALDLSFGRNGVLFVDDFSEVESMVTRSNGKIVVAGSLRASPGARVVQLNVDGSPDASFGVNGQPNIQSEYVQQLVLEPDGHLIILGYMSSSSRTILERISSTGSIIQTSRDDPFYNRITDLAVQKDGRILIIVSSTADFYLPYLLARLMPDLSLDTTFGVGGKLFVAQSGDIFQQSDGKIVVVDYDQTFRYLP
ncbi:NPCBM/NEW2 domain-containing protein [Deinococcus sp.]|uniref:NPCBM/NEW2 domain-containing protein n=1 Tax=Deinococcus sp. TaxID=47478 RepID=UPI003B5B364E